MPNTDFMNHFYSFDSGITHFLVMDLSYYHLHKESQNAIKNWIENDLKNATLKKVRNLRPWIVCLSSEPLFCSEITGTPYCSRNDEDLRVFEGIMRKYKVDLFFSGNNNFYER